MQANPEGVEIVLVTVGVLTGKVAVLVMVCINVGVGGIGDGGTDVGAGVFPVSPVLAVFGCVAWIVGVGELVI